MINNYINFKIKEEISTGSKELDRVLGYLRKGGLTSICGGHGIGRTSFGITIAHNIASKTSEKVMFISTDISKERLKLRRIAMMLEVSTRDIITDPECFEHEQNYEELYERLSNENNLIVHQTKTTSVNHIVLAIEKAVKENDISVVIIDNVELLVDDEASELIKSKQYFWRMHQNTLDVCIKLRRCAVELNIGMIGLCKLENDNEQDKLNNLVEKRGSNNEVITDIDSYHEVRKGSSSIGVLYKDHENNTINLNMDKVFAMPLLEAKFDFIKKYAMFVDHEEADIKE